MAQTSESSAFDVAAALFRATRIVADFIRTQVRPVLETDEPTTNREAVIFTQFLRVDAWMRSLAKLDAPSDFQAVAAATRALLESTIDVVLLNQDPLGPEKVLAWEESAKLKHAQAFKAFLEKRDGSEPSGLHADLINFAKTQEARINRLRNKMGWKSKSGGTRHPDRWTNRSLAFDAELADRAGWRFAFQEFYEEKHREICWLVHGSGFVTRNIPAEDFPALGGLLFLPCTQMSLLSAEVTLKAFCRWSREMEAQFAEIRLARDREIL